jgi:glutamate-1-semialdehyde 2,1-aminomutase
VSAEALTARGELGAPHSMRLLAEAAQYIPGGVNSNRRKIDPPLCVLRGQGAYLVDLDGRRFIDYHAAYGPILLGHAYPSTIERVRASLSDGVLFGVGVTEAEVALARKIVQHVPSAEQVLLCNSGTEATMHSVRLARAVTGRQLIVKFQGGFNGSHDAVLRNVLSPPALIGRRDPGSAGMLDAAVDHTLVCRFNDLADVRDAFERSGEDIAAVILEPILHNAPSIMPKDGFLAGLRSLCDESGALLIFDEIITGFRHHLGGYQAICGVTPDLTAMGKAMANGFPIAAVGGRRELMQRCNTVVGGDVYFGGTYSGNQVGVAAALATIEELERQPVHEHIFKLGELMRDGLREIAGRIGVPAVVSGFGSLYVLNFMAGELTSYDDAVRNDTALQVRYRQELLRRGVFEMPESSGRNHISFSHTAEDIEHTLEVAEQALRAALMT